MDLAVCSRFISIFIIFTTHTACVSANSTCGGKITGEGSGRITSPFYPQMYPKNSNCEWTIVTDIGTGMRIEIEHLNNKELSNSGSIGRCYDTLDIYRALPSGADEQVTPSLCASSIAELDTRVFDVSAIGGSTEVKILFKSDYAVQMSGFSLSFYASCNVTLQGSSGVISSPGYPSDYPKNTVCTTRIVTPTDTRVHLNFLRFFLEDSVACTSDYMSIESSQTGNGIAEVPQRFCGERNPHQIVASSNDIVITFVSDGSFQKYGFDAEWSTDFATQASTEQTSTMETPSTAKPTTVAFISTFVPSLAPDLGHQTSTPEYTGT
uniref:CUB domain-containing protein n=1 Tax=Ciona savignyi TaxID=51511 RepID=H2ZEM9_CIOSA